MVNTLLKCCKKNKRNNISNGRNSRLPQRRKTKLQILRQKQNSFLNNKQMNEIEHNADMGNNNETVNGPTNGTNRNSIDLINCTTRSRVAAHSNGDNNLEFIKQERQQLSSLSTSDIIACSSSPSIVDDDLDHDDVDDPELNINHHQSHLHHSHNLHHHHQHHNALQQHHLNSSGTILSPSKLHSETLSVIVQSQDDSRDPDDSSSQLISPSGKISPNSTEMIDTSDFRALHEPTYQTLTSVNERLSPHGFSPNSSYATLTPLQPLPPISTMSDKFSYGHSSNPNSSFVGIQNNNMGINMGMGVSSPYNYEKLPSMGMSPPHNYPSPTSTLGGLGGTGSGIIQQQRSPLSPHSYNQNGLHADSPQKSMSPNRYDSSYGTDHSDLLTRGTGVNGRQQLQSPTLSSQSVSLQSPDGSGNGIGGANTVISGSVGATFNTVINGIQQTTNQHSSNMCSPLPHAASSGLIQITHMRIRTPSPPLLTVQHTPSNSIVSPNQNHQIMTTKSNNVPLSTTTAAHTNHQSNNSSLGQQQQQQQQNGIFFYHYYH